MWSEAGNEIGITSAAEAGDPGGGGRASSSPQSEETGVFHSGAIIMALQGGVTIEMILAQVGFYTVHILFSPLKHDVSLPIGMPTPIKDDMGGGEG